MQPIPEYVPFILAVVLGGPLLFLAFCIVAGGAGYPFSSKRR